MTVGIFFMLSIIFLISGSVIIFVKKDSAIGGIALTGSLIYFILAILILNSDFQIERINREASASATKASKNVAVSGDVVPVKSSSTADPRYIEIPVLPVQKVPIQQIKVMPIAATNTTTNAKANNENQNKGKIIGDTDSKIYHVPGSTYYEKELQKTSNNIYFNTTAEAEAAGYRAPKR